MVLFLVAFSLMIQNFTSFNQFTKFSIEKVKQGTAFTWKGQTMKMWHTKHYSPVATRKTFANQLSLYDVTLCVAISIFSSIVGTKNEVGAFSLAIFNQNISFEKKKQFYCASSCHLDMDRIYYWKLRRSFLRL